MQKLTIFGPKFDPCGPLFLKIKNKTLLRIYIYYVTILYKNKMLKLKSERGVDVTCRNWQFWDRNPTPVGPYFL